MVQSESRRGPVGMTPVMKNSAWERRLGILLEGELAFGGGGGGSAMVVVVERLTVSEIVAGKG
jgi:hypothetical protein